MVHTLSTSEERVIWGGKSGRVGAGYTGWFPDGSLMRREGGGQSLVFRRVDSRTGEAQASWTIPALPQSFGNDVPSPDLMTMYFWRKDETVPCEGAKCTHVLLALDLETGRDREIFRIKAGYPRQASISHDGRHMAFIAWEVGAQLVMVAPTGGGTPREIHRVTDNAGNFAGTAWTQDGAHVLLFRRLLKGGGGEVWSIATEGGSPEKSPLRIRPDSGPEVSPDGTQVAFVGGSRKSEIWVMTGLFPDAKPAAAR